MRIFRCERVVRFAAGTFVIFFCKLMVDFEFVFQKYLSCNHE